MRKMRLRFGLRTALMIVTLLILAMGLTQARRRSLLKEAHALQASGANFAIDQHWWEKIWLTTPSEAMVSLQFRPDGNMAFSGKVSSRMEAIAYARTLETRLNEFGIGKVHFVVEKSANGTTYLVVAPSIQALASMSN